MSLKKLSDKLILLVGAILTLFQIYTAATMPFPGMQQRSIHLGLGLALVFLVKSKAKKPEHQDLALLLGIILAVVSLVACFNVTWQWLDMAEPMRLTFPETEDFVFGTTLILLVLFGTCKVTGIAMPLIAIFFLAYAYFGKHVPIAMFRHPGVRFSQLISMGYMGTEGIFSSILGVSTNQVFIFLLFGQLLAS